MVCNMDCLNCPFPDSCHNDELTYEDIRRQDKFDNDLLPVEPEIIKRRESQKKYERSDKAVTRRNRYCGTEKGKENQKRYNQTEKRKEQWHRQYLKRKEQHVRIDVNI